MLEGLDRQKLVAFAATIVGSADAEDVVQDAYVAMLTTGSPYRGHAAPMTWARSVVRRQAFRHKRGLQAQAQHDTLGVETLAGEPLDPDHALILREAVDRLPAARRRAVEVYLETGSCQDVADRLGIPYKTAENRLYDARKMLKEMT